MDGNSLTKLLLRILGSHERGLGFLPSSPHKVSQSTPSLGSECVPALWAESWNLHPHGPRA